MRVAVGAFALVLSAAFAAKAEAADAPHDERLERLEEALRRQAAETERLRGDFDAYRRANPARGVPSQDEIHAAVGAYMAANRGATVDVRDDRATGTSSPGPIRWFGYFHWRYLDLGDGASFFDQHRVILGADAAISDCIDLQTEIEFEHGGISDEIEGEIVLEKAELRFHVSEKLVPKVGWLLVPFGRYNLHHDDPLNDLTDRPWTARYLVPTGFGQPGIGVEGAMPFGCGHVFSYDAAVTNGFRDELTANSGVRDARQAEDENHGKQAWARLSATWETGRILDSLETGVSGTYGIYDDRNEHAITGYALDVLARKGPFELKAEWIAYDYERDATDPPDAIQGQSALWLEAAYHFFPCSLRSCSTCLVTDTSHFTLVARYQTTDLDDSVRGATFQDDLRAYTFGLNYRVTERTVLRVDHTWFDAEDADDRSGWSASVSTFF